MERTTEVERKLLSQNCMIARAYPRFWNKDMQIHT